MIDIGISSVFKAYSSNFVYDLNPIPSVKDKQDSSRDEDFSYGNNPSDDINDEAIISDKAKSLLKAEQENPQDDNIKDQADKNSQNTAVKSQEKLTPEQQQELAKLKARDAEVRAHEQAHKAAAAGINASAPSYDYQTGPDGKKYAVGGEVTISFSSSGDPETDIANAEIMKASALAPADPSSQDRAVAQNADKIIAQAKEKLAQEQEEEKNSIKNDESNQTGNNSGLTENLPKEEPIAIAG